MINENNKVIPISILLLTYNEEENINKCLESIRNLAEEIIIVDSGSTDNTIKIAQGYGAEVIEHEFETHSRQWKWALDNISFQNKWLLCLDSDQRLTPEIRDEIRDLFETKREILSKVDGFYIKRRQVFKGKWIRFGGYYPKYLLKLFRRNKVKINTENLVDHHFNLAGKTGKLKNDLIEENIKENRISFWIEKHNRYAKLLAKEEIAVLSNNKNITLNPSLFGNPDQRILWQKKIWNGLPLYLRPFLYFIYRYFILLGFLDGKQGFVFHLLQAFWFRLLVDINIDEMRNSMKVND